MAEKLTYDVHRSMHGDGKDYVRGDTRQLTKADAAPLVANGALSLEGEAPLVPERPAVLHTFGAAPIEDASITPTPRQPSVEVTRATTRKPAKP